MLPALSRGDPFRKPVHSVHRHQLPASEGTHKRVEGVREDRIEVIPTGSNLPVFFPAYGVTMDSSSPWVSRLTPGVVGIVANFRPDETTRNLCAPLGRY